MNELLLHAGAPKTATSTLQKAVLSHHSDIFYIGKIVQNGIEKGCRNQAAFDALQPFLWPEKQPGRSPSAEALDESVFRHAPEGKTVVASWEGLIQNADFPECLQRLVDAGISVKLLITLRNPLTWLGSHYLQHLQGQFIKKNRGRIFGGNPYLTIDQYVSRAEVSYGSSGGMVGYLNNTRRCIEMLGKSRVSVLLFEDLRVDAESYYRRLAKAMGIDADETVKLADGAFSNFRLQRSQVELAKHVSNSFWRRLAWARQSDIERRQAMAEAARTATDDAPAKVQLSEELKQKVIAATREDVAWLNERLDLSFEQHGYPL